VAPGLPRAVPPCARDGVFYQGIYLDVSSRVCGLVYTGLGDEEIPILDAYEEPQYSRVTVNVDVGRPECPTGDSKGNNGPRRPRVRMGARSVIDLERGALVSGYVSWLVVGAIRRALCKTAS
jgi:hypothetical protein